MNFYFENFDITTKALSLIEIFDNLSKVILLNEARFVDVK